MIVIASPHVRNDVTEKMVRGGLPDAEIVRVRTREELAACLADARPEWVFFPHWSWKIPAEIFENHRCVIFHMTDLPYGRGGSPLQNLILRGHRQTKLSAIKCVAELDAGPIYLKHDLSLSGTAEEILQRAAAEIGAMIVELVQTAPEPSEQEGEVTGFERRRPEQSRIPENLDLPALYDFIRMLDADGYPHANVDAAGLNFELRDARLEADFIDARVRIRVKQ